MKKRRKPLTKRQKRAIAALKAGKLVLPPAQRGGAWTILADGGHIQLTSDELRVVIKQLPQRVQSRVREQVLLVMREHVAAAMIEREQSKRSITYAVRPLTGVTGVDSADDPE